MAALAIRPRAPIPADLDTQLPLARIYLRNRDSICEVKKTVAIDGTRATLLRRHNDGTVDKCRPALRSIRSIEGSKMAHVEILLSPVQDSAGNVVTTAVGQPPSLRAEIDSKRKADGNQYEERKPAHGSALP